MGRFTAIHVLLTLSAILLPSTSAAPTFRREDIRSLQDQHTRRDASCMSDSDAKQVANNYAQLISNYSTTLVREAVSSNFTEYSSSTNYMVDSSCSNGPIPLESTTYNSRAAFEAGQGAQPNIPFEILNVWHGCDSVTVRWVSAQTPQDVIGVVALETEVAPRGSKYGWLISRVYSEFNAGAWLVNLGVYVPTCSL